MNWLILLVTVWGFAGAAGLAGELGQQSFSRTGPNREQSLLRAARHSPFVYGVNLNPTPIHPIGKAFYNTFWSGPGCAMRGPKTYSADPFTEARPRLTRTHSEIKITRAALANLFDLQPRVNGGFPLRTL